MKNKTGLIGILLLAILMVGCGGGGSKNVTVDVAPTVNYDQAYSVEINKEIKITLQGKNGNNDYDIEVTQQPVNGILLGQMRGSKITVAYTPNENFVGTDTFGFSVKDNDGKSSTGIVTINVVETTTAKLDTDGDGLSDREERDIYFTSPNIKDTDGDGLSDGHEVLELGFNPNSNLYRFNPLIADLPSMKVEIVTVPELVLHYTDSQGTETSASNSETGGTVTTQTEAHEGGVSVSVGLEVGVEAGVSPKATMKKSLNVTGHYTNTQEESTETHNTWEKVTSEASSTGRETDSASIRVGVNITNNSNLSYTLKHLSLLASYTDSEASKLPIATLSYESVRSAFEATSFAPGETSNTLLFSYDSLDLGTALDILKDSRSLLVDTALFELTNGEGVPIDFDAGEVDAKTAFVLLDYGTKRPIEQYQVSTLSSHGQGSLTASSILNDILKVPHASNGGVSSIRGVVSKTSKEERWVLYVLHNDGFTDALTIYDADKAAYDLSSIEIFPSDQLHFVYFSDEDGDGVGIREEYLNGTSPNKADTDDDGLDDATEIRTKVLVNAINEKEPNRYPSYARSNPLLADADGDLLKDLAERERGLDPNNKDTDGDGISDFNDTFNGQVPVATDYSVNTQSKSAISLDGAATPREGYRITEVLVNWGDGSSNRLTSATNLPLRINQQHDYVTTLNTAVDPSVTFDITITTSSEEIASGTVTTVTHTASVKLFKTTPLASDLSVANGWNAKDHIRTVADVNGDGFLDLVGFGQGDVAVALWDNTSLSYGTAAATGLNDFGANRYGDKEDNPRTAIDLDADGDVDLVGFRDKTYGSWNNSGIFAPATELASAYGSSSGWNKVHLRLFADVDGNGLVDIVGFGAARVLVTRQTSAGTFSAPIEALTTNDFSVQPGWTVDRHYRFMADINNDGLFDIIGFNYDGAKYALSRGDGTFSSMQTLVMPSGEISLRHGWRPDNHPVFIIDMNNDQRPDVVGFGASYVYVALNQSQGSNIQFAAYKAWTSRYTHNDGWGVGEHPRFIADINNDGYNDVVGHGTDQVYVAFNRLPQGEEKFTKLYPLTADFPSSRCTPRNYDAGGRPNCNGNWYSDTYKEVTFPFPFPRTEYQFERRYFNERYVKDVNNDGIPDLIGFGNDGVHTQLLPVITQPQEQ